MRKLVLGLLALGGIALVLGASFLIIERSISQEARAAVRADIEAGLDSIEEGEGGGRSGRRLRNFVEAMRAPGRGMFIRPEIDLAAVLPTAVPGWAERGYGPSDGQRITGILPKASAIAQDPTQSVLARLEAGKDGGKQAQVRVYEGPEGLIAIRLGLDLQQVRRLERADPAEVARIMTPARVNLGGKVIGSIDGLELREMHRDTQLASGAVHRATYLHLRFNAGSVLTAEVIASAPRDQVLALLQTLNTAEIRQGLPAVAQDMLGASSSAAVVPRN